ncbi:YkgJ family cysteine cluster protein [Massilia sp. TS11]|uniref:YkgJ family cysteine cluster protein n=1 Tax=Massilia sp. TS11 TaxID=2908003 RepID=UPI001EDA6B64|nr:YkgJ family cysteine cluster protein [Massilia sp. TS11]MCG2583090.1 YkgJ family cysteine cluster protein [Massilia sp. TS11]
MSTTDNPCLRCGACCATYRVSFYWAEPEAAGLPATLTEQLNPHLTCMAGTNARQPRCRALQGEVGQQVACSVYAHRPTPCRAVSPGSDQCQRARRHHGLPAL